MDSMWPMLLVVFGLIAGVLALLGLSKSGEATQGTVDRVTGYKNRSTTKRPINSAMERWGNKSNIATNETRLTLAEQEVKFQQYVNQAISEEEKEKYIPSLVDMEQQRRIDDHKTVLAANHNKRVFLSEATELGRTGEIHGQILLMNAAAEVQFKAEIAKTRALKQIENETYRDQLEIDQDNITRLQLQDSELHEVESARLEDLYDKRDELQHGLSTPANRDKLRRVNKQIARLETKLDGDEEKTGRLLPSARQEERGDLSAREGRSRNRGKDKKNRVPVRFT